MNAPSESDASFAPLAALCQRHPEAAAALAFSREHVGDIRPEILLWFFARDERCDLATILGITIALTDGCENPNVTLTEALMRALDSAKENGLLSSPILDVLRQALQSGVDASPPPDRGTRLRVVQGEKAA